MFCNAFLHVHYARSVLTTDALTSGAKPSSPYKPGPRMPKRKTCSSHSFFHLLLTSVALDFQNGSVLFSQLKVAGIINCK